MPNRIILPAAVLLLISSVAALAQFVAPSGAVKSPAATDFVSIEGGFTIGLPAAATGYEAIKASEGRHRGGRQFTWKNDDAAFVVGFVDQLPAPADGRAIFELMLDPLAARIAGAGGKLTRRRELVFDGHRGVETVFAAPDEIIVNRSYAVGNRFYSLTSFRRPGASDAPARKILDSFRLIDVRAAIAEKVKLATPAPLPQTPAAPKTRSDAGDENLKGRVRTVMRESEALTGGSADRRTETVTEFDESGNRTKHTFYDEKSRPRSVAVYGYLDGRRVSLSAIVNFNDNPAFQGPLSVMRPPSAKAPDPRYTMAYEYRYADGRLVEEKWIRNDGSPWLTYVYQYRGDRVEESVYTGDGKLNQKYLSVLDAAGREIERTTFNALGVPGRRDVRSVIKYEAFDAQGNWTKRTLTTAAGPNGEARDENVRAEYRTITYYE